MFCSHQVVSNQCVCLRRKQRTHLYSGIAVIFCRRLRSLISWFSNKYNDFFPSTNTTISFPFNQQIQRFVSIVFGDFNSFGMSVICWWYSADSWFSWTRYERYRSSTSHRQMHWAANLTHRKSLQSGEMDSSACHQITDDLSGRMRWINLSSISAQKHTDRNNNPSNLHAAREFRWEGKNSWQIRAIPDEISHHK